MNKKEIIDKAYKRGKKWQGALMACYSREFFTRHYVEDIIKKYHASLTAVNSNIDRLLEHGYITKETTTNDHPVRIVYTISKVGEKLLYSRFPDLAYQMACLLDAPAPGYKLEDNPLFLSTEKEDLKEDNEVRDKIEEECTRITLMLLNKNERYGNSSLSPSGIFTSVKRESKIEARIDDKLARIKNYAIKNDKHNKDYEDAIDDLIGYLILYRIALRD